MIGPGDQVAAQACARQPSGVAGTQGFVEENHALQKHFAAEGLGCAVFFGASADSKGNFSFKIRPEVVVIDLNLGAAAIGSAAIAATATAYVAAAKPVDRPAAAAGLPLLAWVGFATVLSTAVWKMNRR